MISTREEQVTQVSIMAYCSALILKDIDKEIEKNPTKTIQAFRAERMSRSNILEQNPDFKIINAGFIMMLAYAVMVVPWEVWGEKTDDFLGMRSLENFAIDQTYPTERNIIPKKIRNSIAHARFTIDYSTGKIIFKDQIGENGQQIFEASISSEDFYVFLDEFFNLKINPVLSNQNN